ncbi:MAG: L,D-transpeptidase family protein [Eubacteriales bacterium]|nr:L,D-transpeptidase family protein [Eubacteriales bacterium]
MKQSGFVQSRAVIFVLASVVLLVSAFRVIEACNLFDCIAKKDDEGSNIFMEAGKEHEYVILIDVEEKRLYLIEGNKQVKVYSVATGKSGFPSPIGSWKVVSKGSWGGGFGERWLGLNVPWGKYGIHGTNRPGSIGRNASHGCIRMYNKDIRELYSLVTYGTKVIIVNGNFGPFGNGFKPINPGDRGADVYAVQRRLKKLGFYKGYVDGIYGEDMKTAVHSFQKINGLPVENTVNRDDLLKLGFREFD